MLCSQPLPVPSWRCVSRQAGQVCALNFLTPLDVAQIHQLEHRLASRSKGSWRTYLANSTFSTLNLTKTSLRSGFAG
jgi:hypothetical protein